MLTVPPSLAINLSIIEAVAPSRGRHGRRVTQFPSRKNGRVMGCDSLLEADFCLLLERNPNIRSYTTQPCTVELLAPHTRYTPDFEVVYQSGKVAYYEIKHDNKYNSPRNVARRHLYEPLFAECGSFLKTIRQSEIQQAGADCDLKKLYWYSFGAVAAQATLLAKSLPTTARDPQTIGQLLSQGYRMQEIAYGLFYRMLFRVDTGPLHLGSKIISH
ncbi:hypothetical protein [Pseudomonas asiatica]|uniref:hypothetical protein n=1 Tax=Pseudomonas asiatica TaxID=2219225 RepID=UPI002797EA6D|nr:Tn7 transposase TnsA N-terminal domain-containing protein [Pseudomonas shirazica]WGV20560.1 hypothetical protein QIY50_25460 [Pseudomonas putida]